MEGFIGASPIGHIAEAQHGLVTRAQARQAGMTDRAITYRLRQGAWVPVHKSVFRLTGVPVTWEQELLAAVLRGGEGAAASHRSAARLLKLRGDWGDAIEVTTSRRILGDAKGVYHRGTLPNSDIIRISGIATTSVCRTLIDLAAAVTPEVISRALDNSLVRKQVSLPWLIWRLHDPVGVSSRANRLLRNLVFERTKNGRYESPLEEICWRVIESAGLPLPHRQFSVANGQFRLDLAYPQSKLCIECDGYVFHSAKEDWQRDLERTNFLVENGWRVIRTTWDDLKLRPEKFVTRLRAMLGTEYELRGVSRSSET